MCISFTTLGFSFWILRLIKLSFCCFFLGRNGRTARQPSSASTPKNGNNRNHSETAKHTQFSEMPECYGFSISDLQQHNISSIPICFRLKGNEKFGIQASRGLRKRFKRKHWKGDSLGSANEGHVQAHFYWESHQEKGAEQQPPAALSLLPRLEHPQFGEQVGGIAVEKRQEKEQSPLLPTFSPDHGVPSLTNNLLLSPLLQTEVIPVWGKHREFFTTAPLSPQLSSTPTTWALLNLGNYQRVNAAY